MSGGDRAEGRGLPRHEYHQRDPRLFGRGPKPVERAVGEPRLPDGQMEGQADAKHAGLGEPVPEPALGARGRGVESAHHGESVRMSPGGGQRVRIVVADPRRRHQHGPRDAGAVHHAKDLLRAERASVGEGRPVRGPGTTRRVGIPDVDLGVDDRHGVVSSARRAGPPLSNHQVTRRPDRSASVRHQQRGLLLPSAHRGRPPRVLALDRRGQRQRERHGSGGRRSSKGPVSPAAHPSRSPDARARCAWSSARSM